MPNVSVNVQNAGSVAANLEGVLLRGQDLTIPLKEGRQLMIESIQKNFDAEGRPTPWARLSPAYAAWKIKKGYSPMILQRTGRLRASVTGRVEPRELTIGTSVVYGRYHQFGTGKMPMRKFLRFQDEDIANINQLVKEFIVKGSA